MVFKKQDVNGDAFKKVLWAKSKDIFYVGCAHAVHLYFSLVMKIEFELASHNHSFTHIQLSNMPDDFLGVFFNRLAL